MKLFNSIDCVNNNYTGLKFLKKWWALRDLNPRPPACKAGALPTELSVHPLVGARGFEPPTPGSQNQCANRTALRPVPHRRMTDLFFGYSGQEICSLKKKIFQMLNYLTIF